MSIAPMVIVAGHITVDPERREVFLAGSVGEKAWTRRKSSSRS